MGLSWALSRAEDLLAGTQRVCWKITGGSFAEFASPAGTSMLVSFFRLSDFTKCAKGGRRVDVMSVRGAAWTFVFWTLFCCCCLVFFVFFNCCCSEVTDFLTLSFVSQRSLRLRRQEVSRWCRPSPQSVCRASSEGDLDFIYEYHAWSFLIFNKETMFSRKFPTFAFCAHF